MFESQSRGLSARLREGASALAIAGVLCASLDGCGAGGLGFSTQASRIGPDDGTDSCRRELVALDSTGNFFAEDIVKGAALGALGGALIGGLSSRNWRGALIGAGTGVAVGAAAGYWTALQQQGRDQASLVNRIRYDLARENAEIDRSQAAFDALADCRFHQAEAIRTAYAAGQIPKEVAVAQMGQVRARGQRDFQLAHYINGQIAERSAQFEVAADNLSPGTKAAVEAARSARPREAVVRGATAVTLRPNSSSPSVARLQPRESVRLVATRGDYAVVETGGGDRGYAPLAALETSGGGPVTAEPRFGAASEGGDSVRTLASSNAARKDDLARDVAIKEQAAAQQFELAS